MPDVLRLEVTEFSNLTRWRWVLKDQTGTSLADHDVRLDPNDAWFEAFTGLQTYVSWHAAPDKRLAEEARIVTALGDWIGTEVFGPAISKALLDHGQAIVEVILPQGAETLAYLPLETARIRSRSLAAHDITLVIHPPTASVVPPKAGATTDNIRVLGLFSLPEGGNALNLRRERQSLVELINKIAADGRDAEVKVLQYGVTRDRLRDVLDDAEGWDIIHISGHGAPGELILETSEGRPDRISAADMAGLLEAARDRVKLVTVSACWSAALATAEPRRLLGLPTPENQRDLSPERPLASPSIQHPASGDIATALVGRLGCAVLAMRFPVGDEFAIELAERAYALLLGQGESLPRAVAQVLREFTESGRAHQFPALSMVAPASFGVAAADLTLKAPAGTVPTSSAPESPKMTGFPAQPDRFIGRTGVMTRASGTLAPGSGISGVLLHGMPGGGKTACALELAYTHREAFDKLIWYKAPDEGTTTDGSLADFALTLEREVPGLEMIDKIITDEILTAFLPTLAELMERRRLLIVIDNTESLLTETGRWRDEQWGKVIAALTGHHGLGRLIMTSRRATGESRSLRVETVDALSADEALLLTRELPGLRALISGQVDGLDPATARNLALGVLNTAQGHPKLLELASGQAAHPELLSALIQFGGDAWREQGELPDGFFATRGKAAAPPEDYWRVLTVWTDSVAATLSSGERILFWYLCCLREADRERSILDASWDALWQQLGHDGPPPALDGSLTALAARGLISTPRTTDSGNPPYMVHPSVAAAGLDQANASFRKAADMTAVFYWEGVYKQARAGIIDGAAHTQLAVYAALAAIPYLTRHQKWDTAGELLHSAFSHAPTRGNAEAILPAMERIARHAPRQAVALARVLTVLNPDAAETRLRAFIDAAADLGDYQAAAMATGYLAILCLTMGKPDQALDFTVRQADYTRQANLGPWTQLSDDVRRLQVLNAMGHAQQVIDDGRRLLDRMKDLPRNPGPNDPTSPSQVEEQLHGAARDAARHLGQWEAALSFNAVVIASKRLRRATSAELARDQYHDCEPLLRLGRTDEALALLLECRQAFYDTRDFEMLGMTFGALADAEDERGHGDAAIRLQRDSLRYTYLAGNIANIATGYHHLGDYLARNIPSIAVGNGYHIAIVQADQLSPILASHLTAAFIHALTNSGANRSIRTAATDLSQFPSAEPPANVADLCRKLGDIPGTDPAGLIASLCPDSEAAERTLQELIAQAQELASGQS